jgi:osmotically-inducible protein OsmY
MLRTNREVKRDILDHLEWDTRVDADNVQVDVQDGEVTLFGAVRSYVAKRAVEQDAWAIGGVSEVDNEVTVAFNGSASDREQLESHIADRIAWDPQIDGDTVHTTLTGGVVTLKGTVDAYWKKNRLNDLVQDVRGVTSVVNTVSVVPPDDIADQSIARQVVEALRRNDRIDVDTIDVTVENGRVTLSGYVPSWVARNSVLESIMSTSGVVDVTAHLAVRS